MNEDRNWSWLSASTHHSGHSGWGRRSPLFAGGAHDPHARAIAVEDLVGDRVVLDESENLAVHFTSFDTLSRFIAGRLGAA